MSLNVANYVRSREIYCRNSRGRNRYPVEESITSFNERRMRHFYCTNNKKYIIPDDVDVEVPPYAVEFCTAPNHNGVYAVADESGVISIFTTGGACERKKFHESSDLKPLTTLRAHNNAIFDIAWVPGDHIIATASGDQTAGLWDVKKGEVLSLFKGHTCSLKSISVSKHDTNVLASGSRDGNALLWDRRASTHPVLRIQDAHVIKDCLTPMRKKRKVATADTGQLSVDSRQTVSSVVFQDNRTLITAGAMDGMLKIWDLRKILGSKKSAKSHPKSIPKETIPYPGISQRRRGYTCLTIDQYSANLFASCTDDSIYHYNLSTLPMQYNSRQPICKYQGHYNTSFYVRTALSPDGNFLLSGSDDSKAYIWRVDGRKSRPCLRLVSESMSEVTAVAWCPTDITKLVTCSDDCAVRQWELPDKVVETQEVRGLDGHVMVVDTPQEINVDKRLASPKFIINKDVCSPKPLCLSPELKITPDKLVRNIQGNITYQTPTNSKKEKVSYSKTPVSLDKWLTRIENKSTKSRVVKCLEERMTEIPAVSDTNKENDCTTTKEGSIKTNWLLQLAKRKRSNDVDVQPSSAREGTKVKISSKAQVKTPPKKFKRTLDMYFNN